MMPCPSLSLYKNLSPKFIGFVARSLCYHSRRGFSSFNAAHQDVPLTAGFLSGFPFPFFSDPYLLTQILFLPPQPKKQSNEELAVQEKVLSLLVSELSQPNAVVRKNIKSLLHQLAELTGSEVSALHLRTHPSVFSQVHNILTCICLGR